MPLYEIFIGFGAAVVVGLVVFYIVFLRNARPPEREPAYICPYHGKAFYSEKSAYDHAVDKHNAPRGGDNWKHTYNGGGREQQP